MGLLGREGIDEEDKRADIVEVEETERSDTPELTMFTHCLYHTQ